MMLGMATFTIVVSSKIMKKPKVRTTNTTHGLLGIRGVLSDDAAPCAVAGRDI